MNSPKIEKKSRVSLLKNNFFFFSLFLDQYWDDIAPRDIIENDEKPKKDEKDDQLEHTDIFDYKQDEVTKKFTKVPLPPTEPSIISIKLKEDSQSLPRIERQNISFSASLIPNESVIDEKYQNKVDVELKQGLINLSMIKAREKDWQSINSDLPGTNSHESFIRESIYSKNETPRHSK
jgi:hypothetical protein